MKYFTPVLFIVILFISCTNKEKYQGQWTNYFLTDHGYNETRSMVIKNDSIKFNYPYFDYWNTYHLSIENNTLHFNNTSFKTSIEKDTLLLNKSIFFVKDEDDTLYGYKPVLKIKLPEISESYKNKINNYSRFNFIYFGKRLDNNEYSLQLNDNYAEINEIPAFLTYERAILREELIPFFTTILIIDKSTPLKFIENIFFFEKK